MSPSDVATDYIFSHDKLFQESMEAAWQRLDKGFW